MEPALAHVPVIVFTGTATVGELHRLAVANVLLKPFSVDELFEAIERHALQPDDISGSGFRRLTASARHRRDDSPATETGVDDDDTFTSDRGPPAPPSELVDLESAALSACCRARL
jgi:hypothetical protein